MNAKLRLMFAPLAMLTILVIAGPAAAQQPASLDQLLQQTRETRTREQQENKAREQKFLAERNRQSELLQQARSALAQQQQRSDALTAQFDANEAILTELETQLDARKQAFGGEEMFGVVRQVVGDFQALSHNSMISGQYTDREAFAAVLSEAKELPSIGDLERLWFEMQREMTETGKSTHFEATVVDPDGTEATQTVLRVGPFTAVDQNGEFLRYLTESKKFVELGRQPSSKLVSAAKGSFDSSGGYTAAVVDPTRGSLLSILLQRPSFMDQVNAGGPVGYFILTLAAIGILIALERIVGLSLLGGKMSTQRKNLDAPSDSNPLGRVLKVYQDDPKVDVSTLELRLDEAIMREVPKIETRLSAIKVLAAVGPLLGLFGTVIGMIQTFQAITLFGTGDPKLMAGGISQALVTTVLGLVMAIPLVLLHAYLAARAKSLVQILEEESAGIIAEQAEKTHA